nr:putative capsid protein [Cressdnaviricota sp.]
MSRYPNSPPRTPMKRNRSYVARSNWRSMAAAMVGRGARQLAGKAAQAVGRAAASYMAGKRYKQSVKAGTKRRLFDRSVLHTTGQYAGRFKRGRRTRIDPFLQYGFSHTVETTGTVNDADCVYIGCSSHSSTGSMAIILHALLRKLFRKSGIDVTSVDQGIPTIVADCYTLRLTRENKLSGAVSTFDYVITVAASIFSIVGDGLVTAGAWTALMTTFMDYATFQNSADQNIAVPKELFLLRRDNALDNYLPVANIVLENEVVTFQSRNQLKVQNRTLSFTGSADAEDVTNNPLMGRMYHLNAGAPRLKVEGGRWLEAVSDAGGVVLARAGQFSPANNFREPIAPQLFRDCIKHSSIKLEPGQIKYASAFYKVTKPLMKFVVENVCGVSGTAYGSSFAQNKLRGKCVLLALEDIINVNAAQLINVAYEANMTVKAMLSTKGPSVALGKLTTHSYSNTTP